MIQYELVKFSSLENLKNDKKQYSILFKTSSMDVAYNHCSTNLGWVFFDVRPVMTEPSPTFRELEDGTYRFGGLRNVFFKMAEPCFFKQDDGFLWVLNDRLKFSYFKDWVKSNGHRVITNVQPEDWFVSGIVFRAHASIGCVFDYLPPKMKIETIHGLVLAVEKCRENQNLGHYIKWRPWLPDLKF